MLSSHCGTSNRLWKSLRPRSRRREKAWRKRCRTAKDDAALRDLLFLDLALEEFLRGVIERQNLSQFVTGRAGAAGPRNDAESHACRSTHPELALCAGHWEALLVRPRDGRDWALHAKSVADRAARWVAGFHRRPVPSFAAQGRVPGDRVRGRLVDRAAVQRGGHPRRSGLRPGAAAAPPRPAAAEGGGPGRLAGHQPRIGYRAGCAWWTACSTCRPSASRKPPCWSRTPSAATRRFPRA